MSGWTTFFVCMLGAWALLAIVLLTHASTREELLQCERERVSILQEAMACHAILPAP